MTEKFKETEMSKKARGILEGLVKTEEIHPDSSLGREIKYTLKYNPNLIPQFSNEKGLDFNKIYIQTIRPFDYERVILLKRCIEFNLTEEQTHEIIKERYRDSYKDSENSEEMKKMVNIFYPEWCKEYEITPDKNFPDW
jgi:hypothetical protein